MSKKKCTVCDSSRKTLYTTGRLDCNLWVCLPCVKLCNYAIECDGCHKTMCYSTGGYSHGETFCDACHSGSTNMECHACGADIGYNTKREKNQYNEPYCLECIAKTRMPKKKRAVN